MFRAISYILAFSLGIAVAYGLAMIGRISGPSFGAELVQPPEINLSYTDFVTVMFSGATLMLAAVALMVALVAIFTYRGIKNEASRTIRIEVDKELKLLEERIEREVGEEAEAKITKAIERAGRSGALDRALERALISLGQGGADSSGELEDEFEQEN